MTKKDYVLTILENLEKHNDIVPSHLQSVLKEVKRDIQSVSSHSFFLNTNGVITQSAEHHAPDPNPNNPLFRLTEAYDELKKLAEKNRDSRPDLLSVVNQFESLIDASEGYSPE